MNIPDAKRWTVEQTEILQAQWETKLSCAWIAKEINRQTGSVFTRNAVIGKVHRMGLRKRRIERVPARPRKARSKFRPHRHRVVDVTDLFPVLPPDFLGIPFVETTEKTCMYPEGDGIHMLFCGQPRRDESSYCPGHHQLCRVKPTGERTVRWKLWGAAA